MRGIRSADRVMRIIWTSVWPVYSNSPLEKFLIAICSEGWFSIEMYGLQIQG